MDERNEARQAQVVEAVIANGARGFGCDAAAPVGRIDPITDFQLFDVVTICAKNPQ
jgi:hypothetical protein